MLCASVLPLVFTAPSSTSAVRGVASSSCAARVLETIMQARRIKRDLCIVIVRPFLANRSEKIQPALIGVLPVVNGLDA